LLFGGQLLVLVEERLVFSLLVETMVFWVQKESLLVLGYHLLVVLLVLSYNKSITIL